MSINFEKSLSLFLSLTHTCFVKKERVSLRDRERNRMRRKETQGEEKSQERKRDRERLKKNHKKERKNIEYLLF
jgi:hypothetical protein